MEPLSLADDADCYSTHRGSSLSIGAPSNGHQFQDSSPYFLQREHLRGMELSSASSRRISRAKVRSRRSIRALSAIRRSERTSTPPFGNGGFPRVARPRTSVSEVLVLTLRTLGFTGGLAGAPRPSSPSLSAPTTRAPYAPTKIVGIIRSSSASRANRARAVADPCSTPRAYPRASASAIALSITSSVSSIHLSHSIPLSESSVECTLPFCVCDVCTPFLLKKCAYTYTNRR